LVLQLIFFPKTLKLLHSVLGLYIGLLQFSEKLHFLFPEFLLRVELVFEIGEFIFPLFLCLLLLFGVLQLNGFTVNFCIMLLSLQLVLELLKLLGEGGLLEGEALLGVFLGKL
jgi:hypothetical protein